MAKEPVITIPIGDWIDEYQQEETDISTEEAIITIQMEKGYSPLKLGRLVIIARERGDAPNDILPPNKLVLNCGAANEISRKIANRKVEVQIGEKVYKAREFVAPVRDDKETDDLADEATNIFSGSFVFVESDEALARAEKYLSQRVPGYIWGRLLIIAQNGGDVKASADNLIVKIGEMVERLEPISQ